MAAAGTSRSHKDDSSCGSFRFSISLRGMALEGVGGKCLVIRKFSIPALVTTPWREVAGPPTSVIRYLEQ